MDIPCTWSESTRSCKHWLPYSNWSHQKVVFFVPTSPVLSLGIYGNIVDPSTIRELGAPRNQRYPVMIQERVVIEGPCVPSLQCGRVYMLHGSCAPVMKADGWHFQAPKTGHHSGVVQILGWDRAFSTTAVTSTALMSDWPQSAPVSQLQSQTSNVFSGIVDVAGKFHPMSIPTEGECWPTWVQHVCPIPPEQMQATIDGMDVPRNAPLPPKGFIMRLRGLLRGGGKDRSKRVQHLLARGVPSNVVESRADEVISWIGLEGVQEAYKDLEPWARLKALINNRMRMVLPAELKASKQRTSRATTSGEDPDPWLKSDPWSEAASGSASRNQGQAPLDIALIPGTFVDASQQPVPTITTLCTGAHGINFFEPPGG